MSVQRLARSLGTDRQRSFFFNFKDCNPGIKSEQHKEKDYDKKGWGRDNENRWSVLGNVNFKILILLFVDK